MLSDSDHVAIQSTPLLLMPHKRTVMYVIKKQVPNFNYYPSRI